MVPFFCVFLLAVLLFALLLLLLRVGFVSSCCFCFAVVRFVVVFLMSYDFVILLLLWCAPSFVSISVRPALLHCRQRDVQHRDAIQPIQWCGRGLFNAQFAQSAPVRAHRKICLCAHHSRCGRNLVFFGILASPDMKNGRGHKQAAYHERFSRVVRRLFVPATIFHIR